MPFGTLWNKNAPVYGHHIHTRAPAFWTPPTPISRSAKLFLSSLLLLDGCEVIPALGRDLEGVHFFVIQVRQVALRECLVHCVMQAPQPRPLQLDHNFFECHMSPVDQFEPL